MKTNLFYFSSTGNCLVVAKDIAKKLPDTQVFSIPGVINGKIDVNADNIGIIFPVYFLGMPRMVIDFINKLELKEKQYVFAVCTYGGFPGGTLLQTQKQLRAKGIKFNAGFGIKMPGNYLVKYGGYSDAEQKRLFAVEKEKVETIAEIIKDQKEYNVEKSNFLINTLGRLAYKMMLPKFPTLDKNFNVSAKCTSCNLCEKVCPARNIKMADGRPTWQGNCEHCLACIQWCPLEAIQYGTQTASRKRYHHPETSVKEFYRGT